VWFFTRDGCTDTKGILPIFKPCARDDNVIM
jgi:hypothetical protein